MTRWDVFRVTNVSRKLAVYVGSVEADDHDVAQLLACDRLIKPFETFVVLPPSRAMTVEVGEEVCYAGERGAHA